MVRSRPRRPAAATAAPERGAVTAPDASLGLARVFEGIEYRPLGDLAPAQQLFSFAAAAFPSAADVSLAWGAWRPGERREAAPERREAAPERREAAPARLIGALLMERQGTAAMLYGPVVIAAPERREAAPERREAAPAGEPEIASLDVAAQLVAAAIGESAVRGLETLFARPQGLDRIWIRYGFIPVPEGALPSSLRRRPGPGLFAYRGGSALWTFRESGSGARVAR